MLARRVVPALGERIYIYNISYITDVWVARNATRWVGVDCETRNKRALRRERCARPVYNISCII